MNASLGLFFLIELLHFSSFFLFSLGGKKKKKDERYKNLKRTGFLLNIYNIKSSFYLERYLNYINLGFFLDAPHCRSNVATAVVTSTGGYLASAYLTKT